MRWPPWSSGSEKEVENKEKKESSITSSLSSTFTQESSSSSSSPHSKGREWNALLSATDWKHFTEPQNLIPTILLTSGILFVVHIHRRFLSRIPEASNISPSYFRKRSLLGRVTSVGDGDNFRIYHTPGGRLAGWGWLPWKKVPTSRKELKDRTIHIRLAGIDAPEAAHFGRPSQPFSEEARTHLTTSLLHNRIRAYVYRQDQYSRVIATVYKRKYLFFKQDVGLEMLRQGLATVYEAKTGMEFGGKKLEGKYRKAEEWAKKRRKGLWKGKGKGEWESPREYKNRYTGNK